MRPAVALARATACYDAVVHPLVRAAAALAVITALGRLDRPKPARAPSVAPTPTGAALTAYCGPRTVPDGESCVPVPAPGSSLDDAPEKAPAKNAHAGPGGRAEAYDEIPRMPDRPEALSAYVLPIDATAPEVLSPFDLDRPAKEQRQGPGFKAVGHGGVDLAAPRGADARAIALDHQEGSAEVLFAGELFGTTVVTSHLVREGGRLREYLVILGHLEGVGPAAVPGTPVDAGEVLGGVGDTGSPGNVHLHLEVRQVRDGARLRPVDAHKVVDPALTVPCDPRNVLAERAK